MRKKRERRCPITTRPTEFELQAEAFMTLREALQGSYVVRGNWTWPCIDDDRAALPVFDIAIFDPETKALKLIVEMKRTSRSRYAGQGARYTRLTGGVPCMYLRGPEEAANAIELVCAQLSPPNRK